MTSTFQIPLFLMESEGAPLSDAETRSDLFLKKSVIIEARKCKTAAEWQRQWRWQAPRCHAQRTTHGCLGSPLAPVTLSLPPRVPLGLAVLLDDIEMRRTNKISPSVPYALHFRKLLCFAQCIYQPVAEHNRTIC